MIVCVMKLTVYVILYLTAELRDTNYHTPLMEELPGPFRHTVLHIGRSAGMCCFELVEFRL